MVGRASILNDTMALVIEATADAAVTFFHVCACGLLAYVRKEALKR
jgi:hypothetical protein